MTYGTNGAVFSNWAQFRITVRNLLELGEEETLVMSSGHPSGVFPSPRGSPRVTISNGMVVPQYSSVAEYERARALGVTMYGQMTAGSWCYIGPQGIVHGTMLTVLNAGRKYLGSADLTGKVFVTSGLGGMSGAQGKAAYIAGAICVVAEVNEDALNKRFAQGWIHEVVRGGADECLARIKRARAERKPVAIGFLGNVVLLLEALVRDPEPLAELLSDQTSCHNIGGGGYIPVDCATFADAAALLARDPAEFRRLVQASLRRHAEAINRLTEAKGARFFDYGNAFLHEAAAAGADVQARDGRTGVGAFRYPSYVQDIMGDIFSLGFGPFRWVCMSQREEDLVKTDALAAGVVRRLMASAGPANRMQYEDNLRWIESAMDNKLVVGSQARILYSDAEGRMSLALAFNEAVRTGAVSGPVVLSRDHHDVSSVDSPLRETSNVYDGSNITTDMATNNFAGLAARGVTWVALHNGGGTGWGQVTNGGFGLVLDGSREVDERIRTIFTFDVYNGVARRAWAGNDNAQWTIQQGEKRDSSVRVTHAHRADKAMLEALVTKKQKI